MRRIQIYLPDELYNRLKLRSACVGLSVSAIIRRSLEESLARDPASDARAFFARLVPLESFADIEPQAYVAERRTGAASAT